MNMMSMENNIKPIRFKRFFTLILLLFSGWANAQTYVVNSAAAGSAGAGNNGTFDYVMNLVTGTAAGSVIDVNFNIPGTGPFTINHNYVNAFGNRTIRINGSTQPGYTVTTPQIILKSTAYRVFEFDAGTAHLVNGIVFQGATNGILIKGGTGHKVTGCWFGLSATGTADATTAITEVGIFFDNSNATAVTIGGTTALERNVVSNCKINGIRVNNTGNTLNITGNYVGTDPTGTLGRGNGTNDPLRNHGVLVQNVNVTTFNISNNVLSANIGGGIKFENNSRNVNLGNNKIGTDVTGTKALGNKSFGVYVEGGSALNIHDNIISANGSAIYPHAPNYGPCASSNNGKPGYLDYYNSVGIYLFGVSNTQIKGNKIGTDITGTKVTDVLDHDLGNFYAGIKVEQGSSSITIGGPNFADRNIIGGNGFRSDEAASKAQAAVCDVDYSNGTGSKGHGVLFRALTSSTNIVENNFIGVGADNVSKIGNRFSGIEVQGTSNLTISKNILGDNAWGVFIQSNFYDANSNSNKVYGNKIGTDSTGTVALGNGIRAIDNGGGGGITIQHESQTNQIGGTTAGQSNLISGNYVGIKIGGGAPGTPAPATTAKAAYNNVISSNLIGTDATGNVALPNTTNGIYMLEGANLNTLTLNTISGNIQDGVLLDNGDNNTFTQNKIGVGSNGTTALANGGNGILLQNGSTNNKFGGTSAAQGNTITNNTGNGISITGATSTSNTIRNNSISCNTLRGIELNGVANTNYAKPTFGGTETALVITGSAGSWIELYALDGCNDCATNPTNTKLQGKTLLASGGSPLNFAGTVGVKYTATATQGGTVSVIGTNTSEFSDCYNLCVIPTVTGHTITATPASACSGTGTSVTVSNTEASVIYQARVDGTNQGTPVTSTVAGSTITLTLPASAFPTAKAYTITVTAQPASACTTAVALTGSATFTINPTLVPSVSLASSATTVCAGTSVTVTATPTNGGTAPTYQWRVNGTNSGTATTTNTFTSTTLVDGDVISVVMTSNATCASPTTATSTSNITMVVNPNLIPSVSIATPATTVCAGSSVTFTATPTNGGSAPTYQWLLNGANAGAATASNTFTRNNLVNGDQVSVIMTSNATCRTANTATSNVITMTIGTNLLPTVTISPSANPICAGNSVTFTASVANGGSAPSFQWKVNGTNSGAATSSNTFTSSTLVNGNQVSVVLTSNETCVSTNTATSNVVTMTVNPVQNPAASVTATSPICTGNTSTITIAATNGITYTAKDQNNATLGTQTATANGNITITTPALTNANSPYTVTVTATVAGCPDVSLTPVTITVNNPPTQLISTGSVICNDATSGTVTVSNPQAGVTYSALNNATSTAYAGQNYNSATGVITIPTSSFATNPGLNIVKVRATIPGCTAVDMTDTGAVGINRLPSATLTIIGGVICSNATSGTVTVTGAEAGVIYTVYKGSTLLVGQTYNAGVITVPITSLTVPGDNIVNVKANIPGCTEVPLTDTANIKVNNLPTQLLSTGSVVCSNATSATVTVQNPEAGVVYSALNNATSTAYVGQTYNAGTGVITIPLGSFAVNPGVNVVKVRATIMGCAAVDMTDTASVTINTLPVQKTFTASGPLCEGASTTVTLTNPQAGVVYAVYDLIGTTSSTLGNLNSSGIGTFQLFGVGIHTISIKADIAGCTTVDMTATQTVVVNDGAKPITLSGIPTNPLCSDNNSATITITNPEANVNYDVYNTTNGGNIKLNTVSLNTGNPSLVISNIPVGTNTYSVHAIVGGCGDIPLDTFSIKVNQKPDASVIIVSANDVTVCEGTPVVVTANPTRSSTYSYTLLNNSTVAGTKFGNGGSLDFDALTLLPGTHILSVIESIQGCVSDTSGSVTVVVDSLTRTDPRITASADTICANGQVTFTLNNGQRNVSYTLKDNGIVVENKTTTTDNSTITFGPYNNLAIGDHTFSMTAKSAGCDSVNITSTVNVRVNGIPNATGITVTPSDTSVCESSPISVSVSPTKDNTHTYTLLDSGTPYASQRGNSGTITYVPVILAVGTHDLEVMESVRGCASDTSASVRVVVDPKLDTLGPIIAVSDSISCTDTTITVSISNTQQGVTYTLRNNGTAIVPSQTSTMNGQVLTYAVGQLSAGTYVFSAVANSKGCSNLELASMDSLKVSRRPNPDTDVNSVSPICIQADGTDTLTTITIVKQGTDDIEYRIYRRKGIVDSLLASTKTTSFEVGPYSKSGKDTLVVVASIVGCKDVTLKDVQVIEINEYPNLNLVSDGASVCPLTDAQVKLIGTDSLWTYTASTTSTTVTRQGGGDLNFTVPAGNLGSGLNEVTFSVSVPGCGTREVGKDSVYLLGTIGNLTGKAVVCEHSIEEYIIPEVIVAKGYNVTVPNGATFVRNGLVIRVTWGDTSSSGVITVSPIGTLDTCDNVSSRLSVKVYKPFSGTADFINEDTVCVGTVETIGITNLLGVSGDSLEKQVGIDYLDTLNVNGYNRYVVKYNQVGTFYHRYHIYNPCYTKDSVIIDTVVVLPYPQASAGNYPVIDMKYYPREVVLDGSGSTKGDFVYKWSMKPESNINNSTSVIANFVPQQSKQIVYLMVSNAYKGMCPSMDSATIFVDLGIFIPNVFTPNSDGDHDRFVIENVNAFYPDVSVDIYSKWGTLVYHSNGYTTPWDGTRNGEDMPSATYYYVIDLKKPGFKPLAGSVTIIR